MSDKRFLLKDMGAIGALVGLWLLYWWRSLTPNLTNRLWFPEGDFTGQFYAFGAYQARRLLAGEVPLWNPFNLAGHPFLADTQSAVFYPPRLVTILVGEWTITALEREAITHFLIAALLMYTFVRVITGSRMGGMLAAITWTFGGFLTSYPPLQLAILEAAVWLPLALLGLHLATEGDAWRIEWVGIAGLALGLSLLAGHPQTGLFFSYMVVVYGLHRGGVQQKPLLETLAAMGGVVVLGYGLAALQLMPGLEYTRLTTRADIGFDALRNGFAFQDIATVLFPGLRQWSPLYVGIAGLGLLWVSVRQSRYKVGFWVVMLVIALLLSFGGSTLVYHVFYLIVPGFSWFRGQERSAFLAAFCAAVLIGYGVAALRKDEEATRHLWQAALVLAGVCGFAALQLLIADAYTDATLDAFKQSAFFSFVGAALLVGIVRLRSHIPSGAWGLLLGALVVFDLFSVTMNSDLQPEPPDLLDTLVDDMAEVGLYRVEAREEFYANYGTLVGFEHIRGISPLKLQSVETYLDVLPPDKVYGLLNVGYVATDGTELTVPSRIVAEDDTRGYTVNLHALEAPHPRAWMVYTIMDTPDEAQALGWLADPSFDVRQRATLEAQPPVDLPEEIPAGWRAEVTDYAPEEIGLRVATPTDGVLVLSELDYPGWQATVDGQETPILRANAGLRAVALEAGTHEVIFSYQPVSFQVGVGISVAAFIGLCGCIGYGYVKR